MSRLLASVAKLFRGRGAVAGAEAAGASRVAGAASTATLATRVANAANIAFAGNQLLGGLQSIIHAVTNDFTHVITVEVRGGPRATIQRIWQLAVSAAFGKYRQGVNGGGDLTLAATWDITGKAVSVQLHYTNTGLLGAAKTVGPLRHARYVDFLVQGPSQELVGGDWRDFTSKVGSTEGTSAIPLNEVLANINKTLKNALNAAKVVSVTGALPFAASLQQLQAAVSTNTQFAALPDDGRVILTAAKENPEVQPYRPDTDYLIALVSAALVDPCIMPVSPPTDVDAQQKKTRLGYRVYSPGSNALGEQNKQVNHVVDQTQLQALEIPTDGFLPVVGVGGARFFDRGVDGYAEPGTFVPNVRGEVNEPG